MLEHLLGEVLSLIGQGVVVYAVLGAILRPLLWLLRRISPPIDRLDRWLKSHAPQRTYTVADHVRGYAVVGAVFGLVALLLHHTVGLR